MSARKTGVELRRERAGKERLTEASLVPPVVERGHVGEEVVKPVIVRSCGSSASVPAAARKVRTILRCRPVLWKREFAIQPSLGL